jgi:hypothetical protein
MLTVLVHTAFSENVLAVASTLDIVTPTWGMSFRVLSVKTAFPEPSVTLIVVAELGG